MWVITGGGSGIGRALAVALAARGEQVLVVGRREQPLQETAQHANAISYLVADVSKEDGLRTLVDFIKNKPLKGLINNAGTLNPIAPIQTITPADWRNAFQTNVDAALFLPQRLLPQLEHGRVLNIGSGAAYFPIKGWSAYCITKAALAMLTRCWQLEEDSVAFASVKPGIVDTDMQAIARQGAFADPEHVAFYQRLKNEGRLLTPETVAAFLTWLLLDIRTEDFSAQEWDIYDKSHHAQWLRSPHQVLHWDDV